MTPQRVRLPETPRDLFRLSMRDRLLLGGIIGLHRALGPWRYPARASGDIETMSLHDKAYWLHKTTRPVRKAPRGSGLEAYFRAQQTIRWVAPEGFSAERQISISSAGDLINHPFLRNSAESLYGDAAVRELLFGADVAMANLECPIIPGADIAFEFDLKKAPSLAYDEACFEVVKGEPERSFSFLATACNHSLDFGLAGIDSTLAALDGAGIAHSGSNGAGADAPGLAIVEKNGIRIGVIAFTFGLNGQRVPPERPYAVNRMALNDELSSADVETVRRVIESAVAARVDFLVAHLHWGMEHEFYPRAEQVEVAHRLAEAGVDAIIGHHPHVAQPMELYRPRREPARLVPVFYSLGNLVNSFTAPYLRESAVARLELVKGRCADGTARVFAQKAWLTPVVQEVDEAAGQLRLVVGTLASAP